MTKPDNAIGNFWLNISNLMRKDNNKTWHKQLIHNGYKYQWEQSNFNNTN